VYLDFHFQDYKCKANNLAILFTVTSNSSIIVMGTGSSCVAAVQQVVL